MKETIAVLSMYTDGALASLEAYRSLDDAVLSFIEEVTSYEESLKFRGVDFGSTLIIDIEDDEVYAEVRCYTSAGYLRMDKFVVDFVDLI